MSLTAARALTRVAPPATASAANLAARTVRANATKFHAMGSDNVKRTPKREFSTGGLAERAKAAFHKSKQPLVLASKHLKVEATPVEVRHGMRAKGAPGAASAAGVGGELNIGGVKAELKHTLQNRQFIKADVNFTLLTLKLNLSAGMRPAAGNSTAAVDFNASTGKAEVAAVVRQALGNGAEIQSGATAAAELGKMSANATYGVSHGVDDRTDRSLTLGVAGGMATDAAKLLLRYAQSDSRTGAGATMSVAVGTDAVPSFKYDKSLMSKGFRAEVESFQAKLQSLRFDNLDKLIASIVDGSGMPGGDTGNDPVLIARHVDVSVNQLGAGLHALMERNAKDGTAFTNVLLEDAYMKPD